MNVNGVTFKTMETGENSTVENGASLNSVEVS